MGFSIARLAFLKSGITFGIAASASLAAVEQRPCAPPLR
jgi:hypothetical protein